MRVKYKDDYIVDYGGNTVTISLHRRKDPEYLQDPAMICSIGWYIFVDPIGDRRGTCSKRYGYEKDKRSISYRVFGYI